MRKLEEERKEIDEAALRAELDWMLQHPEDFADTDEDE